MSTTTNQALTIQATVNAPVEKVWNAWSNPEHYCKMEQCLRRLAYT